MTAIDQPFRLSRDVLVAWALLAFPSLILTQPWQWSLPLYSQIAGILFIPFAAMIVLYCPILLLIAVFRSGSRGRVVFGAFILTMVETAAALGILFVSGHFEPVNAASVFAISAGAIFVFNYRTARKA